jgi:hypothetical protein
MTEQDKVAKREVKKYLDKIEFNDLPKIELHCNDLDTVTIMPIRELLRAHMEMFWKRGNDYGPLEGSMNQQKLNDIKGD